MKNMTKGIIASLSAAAVITTGAFIGVSATTAEPEETQAAVVTVDENTLRQETPNTVRQTVLPAPVVEEAVIEPAPAQEPATEPAPAPAPEPAPEPEAWVNDDGTVEGAGCPSPYVDLGYGCQDPICGVDANGNDIPCQG